MKKLPLALVIITTLMTSAIIVSCKKETDSTIVPIAQPGSQVMPVLVNKAWEVSPGKSTLEYGFIFSKKLKPEFEKYATDTTVAVSCRIKFKDKADPVLLPFSASYIGGVRYYFFTLDGGKPKILFHDTGVCEFDDTEDSGVMPIEKMSFVFSKINFEE